MRPLVIDLYCGLGGWAQGLLAEGYDVIGFDIEEHVYGEHRYPGQLVVQDVRTLHGSQFKGAALIVASPPCQEYSYMAMPWKRAKAKAAAIRADETGQKLADLNRLFNECFRIQRQASFAAGRHIPMVVENVRGAQAWVGRARWNFGSFYLWGDVPALMPKAVRAAKVPGLDWNGSDKPGYVAQAFNTTAEVRLRDGHKAPGVGSWDRSRPSYTKDFHGWDKFIPDTAVKVPSDLGRCADPGKGARFTSRDCGVERHGLKQPGLNLSDVGFNVANAREFASMVEGAEYRRTADDKRQHIGKTRKFASAMIAKIPLPLSRHIGAIYRP